MASFPLPRTLQPPPELPGDPTISDKLAQYLRTFSLWCRHGFADKLSISGAAPGVLLQSFNPPTGQTPSVWLLQVGEDGWLWVRQVAFGSGDLGTAYRMDAGTTDGSDAPAGQIGEYIEVNRDVNLSMTNNVMVNIVSASLTAGDWDVEGAIQLAFSVGGSYSAGAVSTVSASFPSGDSWSGAFQILTTGSTQTTTHLPTGPSRISIVAPTTIYLTAIALFASGTCNGQGTIRARRMR